MPKLSHCLSGLLIGTALVATFPAMASGPTDSARVASLPSSDPPGRSARPTLAPFAHVVFCKSRPAECRTDGRGDAPIALTAEVSRLLKTVNRRVNQTIRPVEDGGGPLDDVWRVAPAAGDCDDFAVTKRTELIRAGLPVGALRLMVGRTPQGEGHAVLAVRTTGGDLVLDNLTDQILDVRQSRFMVLKFQSGTNPERWFSPSAGRVASLD